MIANYIAHLNKKLCEHLEGVAKLANNNTQKIGMGKYGELLGLLHSEQQFIQEMLSLQKQAIYFLRFDIHATKV